MATHPVDTSELGLVLFAASIALHWAAARLHFLPSAALLLGAVMQLLVPALPWAACFALGAIVLPPDAAGFHPTMIEMTRKLR
ncbi:hypothetical protein [Sphingomonas sp. TDK1]|uniref:hypothetical protein n=1 Tax=Sphingomonas sp. TDK1 TaxID=453247 RepID=UPI0007D922F0|nr:hypothetical protein [Sphingomonas sp. TDK1]OAN62283.1 hypothetical protein A7X12_22615 [Sphingomonas sp. TDK1]